MKQAASQPLFNSTLETGVRTVVLLDAASPQGFDLTHLTWLDHLVVHTADIGGPESLHPDIPQRAGELVVRRQLVEDGLTLMRRLHLVDVDYGSRGIAYRATDEASLFVQLVRSKYGLALKHRAEWLMGYLISTGEAGIAAVINEKIGRWSVEFQADSSKGAAV